jgi:hypothetical protein
MTETAFVGSEAGVSDLAFAARLRGLLRDTPVSANETTSGNGSMTAFQMNMIPVYQDQYVSVLVGGVPVPVVVDRAQLTTSNCFMDCDSGLLVFGTAPPATPNNIAIQKSRVRWTNANLLSALYGGLRQLFPAFYKRNTSTSITMQVNQWLYELPQDFLDPRVRILSAWIQEVPSSVNRPIPLGALYRMGLTQIQVPSSQWYTPGATLWLEYTAPYRNLSELEPQLFDLPIWYAAAQLLGFDEAKRTRVDTQSPAAEASANPPGYQQNAGTFYMTQFYKAMGLLASPPPRMPRPLSTYSM